MAENQMLLPGVFSKEDPLPEPVVVHGPPIFGVQATWVCFGVGLAAHFEKDNNASPQAGAEEVAEIAFLYKLDSEQTTERTFRLRCPALNIDMSSTSWPELHALISEATMSAARQQTGKEFSYGDPRKRGTGDVLITTAWVGEFRTQRRNKGI